MKKINIGIVEDHQLVRQGMISLLKQEEGLNIAFDVSNGQELLDKIKDTKVQVILLDIAMPVMDGKEVLKKIKVSHPEIETIVVSAHFSDIYVSEMLALGAKGFLPKNCDIEKVIDAIFAVADHQYYFDNAINQTLVQNLVGGKPSNINGHEAPLSDIESEILKLICLEKTNQEISEIVFRSKRTVEWHKNNMILKTGSKNIVGLVKYAIKNKIVPED